MDPSSKTGNVKVLQELWNLAKEKGNPEEINCKLLLVQNENGQTALHLVVEDSVAVLETLWASIKKAQLNEYQLLNKLLQTINKFGYSTWHRAAEGGTLEALETL
jgi:predicted amidohydrolase YtcJ